MDSQGLLLDGNNLRTIYALKINVINLFQTYFFSLLVDTVCLDHFSSFLFDAQKNEANRFECSCLPKLEVSTKKFHSKYPGKSK